MIPTSGDCSISETASNRQSPGTRVSESTKCVSHQHKQRKPEPRTDEDIIANADVPIRPRTAILLEDLVESPFVSHGLIRLRPGWGPVNQLQLLLDLAGNHKRKVHIRGLLKFSATQETILAMSGTSNPANAMVGVEINASLPFLLR